VRRLKHRKAPLLATLMAVALGAALVAACGGLFETALHLEAPPQRLAHAEVVVAASEHATLAAGDGRPAQAVTLSERARVPADAVQRIAAVEGVARAVPLPSRAAVAVDARAGVDPAALAARIRTQLGGSSLSVLTGDDRGRAETTGVAASRLKLILLSGVFGGTALIVMAILLASIIGLSVEQRRRELALLRTIGATPRQVRRMVVSQTVRPAALAAVAGALAGPVLARALFGRIQDGGVVPEVLALRQGVLPIVVGAVAALLAVRVSAGLAARRAARARFGEALGEVEEGAPGAIGPVRLALAAVAAAGAVSCAAITLFMSPANASATGGGTALAGAIACALVAPRLTERLAGRLSGVTARLAGLPGELAVANVRTRAHRTAALVTPVILVASIALANVYQTTTAANAMRSAYLGDLRADAVVTSTTGSIPAAAAAAAAGVGSTSGLTTGQGWIEDPVDGSHRIDPWSLLGVDPFSLKATAAAGSLEDLRGAAVALPQGLAGDLGIDVGDEIGVVLGDGAHVRVRVAALLDGSSRHRSLVLPAALLAAHTTAGEPQKLLVRGDDVRERLAQALAADPRLTVRGTDALADDFDAGLQVDAWITFAVVAVIVAFAAMSLVNSLVAALGGRRRELALLRLAGASARQVRRMLETEALLVAAIGAIAGSAVALFGLIPLSVATAGSPLPSGPIWVFAAVLALIAALVLIPTLVVSRTTLSRKKVADVEAL
jgi:putative ABC transport system permease protein